MEKFGLLEWGGKRYEAELRIIISAAGRWSTAFWKQGTIAVADHCERAKRLKMPRGVAGQKAAQPMIHSAHEIDSLRPSAFCPFTFSLQL